MHINNDLLTRLCRYKELWPSIECKGREKPTIETHWRKSDSRTNRTSPPLWHAHFTSHATHWSTLVRHPVNGHVSILLSFFVSCCHHTGSNNQWSALEWVCQGKTQKVRKEWLDNESSPRMEYGAYGDDHAEEEILDNIFKINHRLVWPVMEMGIYVSWWLFP